jgi:hypothetical protein
MKRLTHVLILSLLAVSVKAQQPILFKIKYLPNHIYKMSMNMETNMEMAMPTGGGAKSNQAAAPGTFNQAATSTIQSITNTGAAKADHTFPIKMQIVSMITKAKMNGVESNLQNTKSPLVGQVINGQCDADGKMHMDAVKGTDPKAATNARIIGMMNQMQGQIKFPEKSLAVGESFTQDTPISMPASGINMQVKAKTTYKLTAVKGNLAYFDTKVAMTFGADAAKTGKTMAGGGNGTGKMVYNIAENNFISMDNAMDMKYNMDMMGQAMAVKMKMIIAMKYDISK